MRPATVDRILGDHRLSEHVFTTKKHTCVPCETVHEHYDNCTLEKLHVNFKAKRYDEISALLGKISAWCYVLGDTEAVEKADKKTLMKLLYYRRMTDDQLIESMLTTREKLEYLRNEFDSRGLEPPR